VARRWGVTPEGLRSKARTKTLTIPALRIIYRLSSLSIKMRVDRIS